MSEWNGPNAVYDGLNGPQYGWYWSKTIEHRGFECELVLSTYDDENARPDLIIYYPNGYESFAYAGDEEPNNTELCEWADDVWDDFTRNYDYLFDV